MDFTFSFKKLPRYSISHLLKQLTEYIRCLSKQSMATYKCNTGTSVLEISKIAFTYVHLKTLKNTSPQEMSGKSTRN